MARSPKISQTFQGMILEKRAAGLSDHTISDYQNTLKKVLLYFPNDPQIATITRDQLIQFFAWLHDDYISRPDGAARRKPCSLSAKSRRCEECACTSAAPFIRDRASAQRQQDARTIVPALNEELNRRLEK